MTRNPEDGGSADDAVVLALLDERLPEDLLDDRLDPDFDDDLGGIMREYLYMVRKLECLACAATPTLSNY